MRKPDFDVGGGKCRNCKTTMPDWYTLDTCDTCMCDSWTDETLHATEGDDDDRRTDPDCD